MILFKNDVKYKQHEYKSEDEFEKEIALKEYLQRFTLGRIIFFLSFGLDGIRSMIQILNIGKRAYLNGDMSISIQQMKYKGRLSTG